MLFRKAGYTNHIKISLKIRNPQEALRLSNLLQLHATHLIEQEQILVMDYAEIKSMVEQHFAKVLADHKADIYREGPYHQARRHRLTKTMAFTQAQLDEKTYLNIQSEGTDSMTDNEQPKRPETKRETIAMWCIGLFFLLCSFADFLSPLPNRGYVGLIIACLFLPPTRLLFHRMTGLNLSGYVRIALCLALLLLGGQFTGPRLHPLKAGSLRSVGLTEKTQSAIKK